MSVDIRPITSDSVGDLAKVFCGDPSAEGCWCMWFIIPVKEYHAAGSSGNRAAMTELIATSRTPAGLIAYEGAEPIGWVAVGPRARFARAIKTPTYRGREPSEDDETWLVPCLYVRPESRGSGLTTHLLEASVELARSSGARAIEGFPYNGKKKRTRDSQVGFNSTFSDLGFQVVASPSDQRAIVRLEFEGGT